MKRGDIVEVKGAVLAKVLKIRKDGWVEVQIRKANDQFRPQFVSPFKKYKPIA